LSHGFCANVRHTQPEAKKARARIMVGTSNSRSYHN